VPQQALTAAGNALKSIFSFPFKVSEEALSINTRQEREYRTGHITGPINFPLEPAWWSRWRKAGALKNPLSPKGLQLRKGISMLTVRFFLNEPNGRP
jgi:hypothetical protein